MEDSSAPLRMDLNCVPGIQEEEDPPGDVSLQQHSQQARIISDLELNMQALSLSAPAVCNLEAGQTEQNQEVQETYMLFRNTLSVRQRQGLGGNTFMQYLRYLLIYSWHISVLKRT
jgi:hypothetical protein